MRNLKLNEIYYISFSVFILNVLDVILTLIGLSLGHTELNPLFEHGYNAFNLPFKLLSISFINCAFFFLFSKFSLRRDKRIIEISLILMLLYYAFVTLNNLTVVLS